MGCSAWCKPRTSIGGERPGARYSIYKEGARGDPDSAVRSALTVRTMAVYATYRHIELDKIGYGKKR